MADYSAVKHGGMHTDEAVVLNSAGMQQSAVAYGYIIAYDAGVFVGNVQYAVVLDVAVAANLDTVNVAADSNAGPNAGVLFKLNLADQSGSIKGVGLLVNFGGLCFKFENHFITAFCKLAAFTTVLKEKQFILTLLLLYEQIIKSRRSHLFCRCEGYNIRFSERTRRRSFLVPAGAKTCYACHGFLLSNSLNYIQVLVKNLN